MILDRLVRLLRTMHVQARVARDHVKPTHDVRPVAEGVALFVDFDEDLLEGVTRCVGITAKHTKAERIDLRLAANIQLGISSFIARLERLYQFNVTSHLGLFLSSREESDLC